MDENQNDLQARFQKALIFAGERHGDQKMPASEASYLIHLSNVAMEVVFASPQSGEFDLGFAVEVALLHDVIEDTPTTFEDIEKNFSRSVADAVLALTKNENLPREDQIADSLKRIRRLRKEVWAVKLADRISNMKKPPDNWSKEKRIGYRDAAILILEELSGGNAYLEDRLAKLIELYGEFI